MGCKLNFQFQVPSKENISTLSALEVAEQITYLDQKIMFTIISSEFLEQAWLKSDKSDRSPHIVIMTKRFNDVSIRHIIFRKKRLIRIFRLLILDFPFGRI